MRKPPVPLHKPLVFIDPALKNAPHAWAAAVGAPFFAADGTPVDAPPLPGTRVAEGFTQAKTDMLRNGWNVEGRDDLIDRLQNLGEHGHRRKHLADVRYYSLMRRPRVAALLEEMRADIEQGSTDAREERERLTMVQANTDDIRAAKFLAFDTARAVMLAYSGCLLGWLTAEETWRYLLEVARDVQRHYDSWQDYGADFIRGRNYWAGEVRQDAIVRATQFLLADRDSPWRRLAWQQPALALPVPLPGEIAQPYWSLETT